MRRRAARLAWAAAAAALTAACSPAQKPAASTAIAAETPAVPVSETPAAPASSAADSAPPPASSAAAATQASAEDLIRSDKALAARDRRMHAMYENALSRDPTGEVRRQQSAALAARKRCHTTDCLESWFSKREAALKQWEGN